VYTRMPMKLRPIALLFTALAAIVCSSLAHSAQDTPKKKTGAFVRIPSPIENGEEGDVRPTGGVPDSLRVTFTREQMREDVATWKAALEEYCAGLHRYVNEEDFEQLFTELDERLEPEMPMLAFFRELMRVGAKIRHVRLSLVMPAKMSSRAFGKESNVLPLRVHVADNRIFAVGALGDSPGLPLGSELLEIEGTPVSALLQTIYDGMPCEGYVSTNQAWRLSLGFPLYYLLLIDETLADYDVTYRTPNGVEETVTLQGVLGQEAFAAAKPNAGKDPLELELLEDKKLAILSLRSLYERDLTSGGFDFEQFVADTFEQIAEKKVERLVLDLRGNERGSDVHGVTLVSYLVDQPYRYFKYVKVASTYNGNQDVAVRSSGERVLFPYAGMGKQQPKPDPFLGELIVLIDGGTFGAAADVAAVLHRLERATFVGEETGGVYDGSTIGTVEMIRLPNSDLSANLPILDFELYGGDPSLFGLGVPPHHTVPVTVEDLIGGRDTALQFVLGTLLKD